LPRKVLKPQVKLRAPRACAATAFALLWSQVIDATSIAAHSDNEELVTR
jgi:hypothetical protein